MVNLLEYANKHITVTFRDEDENKTITGLVTMVNAMVMLVRPKGRPYVLVDVESVASIQAVDEPVKVQRIKVRSMEKILPDQVRQHLADRHGFQLHKIPDGQDVACGLHDLVGHDGLGHHHRPDVDEVADRAAVLDSAPSVTPVTPVEDREINGPGCHHQGIECEDADCPCDCVDCMNEDDDNEEG